MCMSKPLLRYIKGISFPVHQAVLKTHHPLIVHAMRWYVMHNVNQGITVRTILNVYFCLDSRHATLEGVACRSNVLPRNVYLTTTVQMAIVFRVIVWIRHIARATGIARQILHVIL